MNLARSSIKLFVGNVVTAALGFIGITIFARELGASEIGVFFLFQALLGMLAIPADFGVRAAVEKRISEGEAPSEFLSSALLLKVVPITVIVLGILLARPLIQVYVGSDIAIYLAAAIVFQELAQLSVVVLKGELRVGETAVLQVARQATWVGFGVILVSHGYAAEGIIYSLLAGLGVVLVWGWYKTSISLAVPSVSRARSLFDYGKYAAISSVGGYVYSWMDVALIGLFLTQAHVGAYEVAWRVTAVSILFSQAISMTIFPQVSEWSSEGAEERIENLLPTAIAPSLFLVIPAFFGSLLFARDILAYIFGQEYTIAAFVLVLLMADKVFQAIQVVVGKSLQAINKPDLAARATVVSIVLNGIMNVILILEFGIIGAAVATVTSSLANDLLHFIYLRRYIRVSLPYREIAESIFASVVMVGSLVLLEAAFGVNSLIDLFAIVAMGALIYFGCSLLLPNLRKQIFHILERIGILPS